MRFLKTFAEKYHRPLEGIDASAQAALMAHSWSGNIRELQNCIEKAVILSDGSMIGRDDIGFETSQALAGKLHETMPVGYDEERMVRDAMAQCRGNISAAARMLGVSRPTFYAKLKKYGL
jgi:DNA-binding NtrC family response regulator